MLGHQLHRFFKPNALGPYLSGAGFAGFGGFGVLDMGHQLPASPEKAPTKLVRPLFVMCHCTGGGVLGSRVSASSTFLHVVFLLFCCGDQFTYFLDIFQRKMIHI